MKLQFWKLTGAGNDFMAFNNLDGKIPEAGRDRMIAEFCRRALSVGADGVLMVEPSANADFRMRYYNADGGEVETCGNGARCIARFAHVLGLAPAQVTFETSAGTYRADVKKKTVTVDMTPPFDLERNIELDLPEIFQGFVDFVNTGVPHVVIFTSELENADVERIGRAIRYHSRFDPPGTNVNFVRISDAQNLQLRTYERGVEAETLACGTGAVAAAYLGGLRGKVQPPVAVQTRGGQKLMIHYRLEGNQARDVRLEGEARIVYRGEIEYDFQDPPGKGT